MKLPRCEACGKPVTKATACLWYSLGEGRQRREAIDANLGEHTDEHGFIPGDALLRSPDAAPWHWTHLKCGQALAYEIEATRLDTLGKVIEWTFHLGEKSWFELETWADAIRRLHDIPTSS